jgi:multicomponent Na+:H+ antiporter subunit F
MILTVLITVLFISMTLVLVRALMGPTLFDRLLAVNSFGTKIILFIAAYGFFTGRPDFLDLAIVYALINYIGTIAVLKFFEYDDLGSGAYQPSTYEEDDI